MTDRGRDSFWSDSMAHVSAMWREMFRVTAGSVAAFGQAQRAGLEAATRSLELMTYSYARLFGQKPQEVIPPDKRFADEAWSENLAFDMMRQAYLITSKWLQDMADGFKEIDPALHRRAVFYTRQFTGALSPANFALTNPVVIGETIRSGGANLMRGAQHFLADLQNGKISQVAEDTFVVGKNLAITPGKVVYRNRLIELIQYTPMTDRVRAVPILLIAPWVNKYYVMDMRPENSMFKYLVDSGFTVFAISWKNPDTSMRDIEWEDYMAEGPLAALRVIKSITASGRVNIAGYCLGGILLEVTLAYLAAKGDPAPNTATYFATHADFSDVGDLAAFISDPEVRFLEWLMDLSGGYLDGRNMAATFNMLRANDLLWHSVVNNYLMGKELPAFDLLYWNADGTRVPKTVHSFLLRNFFLVNNLTKPDHLKMLGVGIDPRRITVPSYVVGTNEDHIVPWRSAYRIQDHLSGPVRFILAESGHVAGIINPPTSQKRSYWSNEAADTSTDPDTWLNGATKHQGSWWIDWSAWLADRSGELIALPPIGTIEFPPIMDAPGTYVLEK